MKLIDVSVPIDARLATYPGNTPFSLEAIKRIANGGSSNVSTLHMSAHGGTHVDAPRHYFDQAGGVEDLQRAATLNPNSTPAALELQRITSFLDHRSIRDSDSAGN